MDVIKTTPLGRRQPAQPSVSTTAQNRNNIPGISTLKRMARGVARSGRAIRPQGCGTFETDEAEHRRHQAGADLPGGVPSRIKGHQGNGVRDPGGMAGATDRLGDVEHRS
jgi:hypothetical protein